MPKTSLGIYYLKNDVDPANSFLTHAIAIKLTALSAKTSGPKLLPISTAINLCIVIMMILLYTTTSYPYGEYLYNTE